MSIIWQSNTFHDYPARWYICVTYGPDDDKVILHFRADSRDEAKEKALQFFEKEDLNPSSVVIDPAEEVPTFWKNVGLDMGSWGNNFDREHTTALINGEIDLDGVEVPMESPVVSVFKLVVLILLGVAFVSCVTWFVYYMTESPWWSLLAAGWSAWMVFDPESAIGVLGAIAEGVADD